MKEKIDLVTQPKKSFWKLSLPIIAFCLFDAIYGIVDMLWVSQISSEAFFAMGMSIPFVTFIFSVGDAIGQGTNSIMSRFIGSGDYESSYNALIHGMIVCNVIWFIIVLCFLFANGVLFYVDDSNSYILIFDYLVPMIVFAYMFIFCNLFGQTMQAEGNSKTPAALMIGANILNLILDPIFIFYLNLGIKGAAYATVLSAALVFFPMIFLYLSGRTKIPLSFKYFKFHSYIIVEIFKVALPNFIDNGLWLLLASFVNSTLVLNMNAIGPVLYSVANKIENLLSVPTRGYGKAFMSITGHLFGAHKLDELKEMYKYVLKLSVGTTAILMVIFFIVRDYVFGMFSINGMSVEIFWITVGGAIAMLGVPISIISSKILDGLGKGMYSLMFTVIKVFLDIGLIIALIIILDDVSGILISIVLTDVIIAMAYYWFVMRLFKIFKKKYDGKPTVKTFTNESTDEDVKATEEIDPSKYGNFLKNRIIKYILLISMTIAVLLISNFTLSLHSDLTLIIGIAAIIVTGIISYFIDKFGKIKHQIIEIIIITVVLILLLEGTDYLTTVLFIVIGVMLQYILSLVDALIKK